ncbi:MAG: hypothetical protein KGH57_00565 [Candidatus Micrarchaeota archaeon]|nr:hypothetical protein [Candidatus Micrarchaeota archaeon]
MVQEEATAAEAEPKVEQVEFPGKLLTSIADVKGKLASIPFYSLQENGDSLEIARVESRNIHKKPFLFYIMTVGPQSLSLVYSIVPGSSDRLRRATVIKDAASVLSVIRDSFQVDESKFFQYVDSVLDNLVAGLSQSYSTLFNKYDSLLNEFVEAKKLLRELETSNRNLTIQTSQLSEDNKSLTEQLKSLQTYSDESLMAMVQDWIEVHNSSIDVGEFAKTYKVPEPRIEQILDKMVSMGYIELKG